MKTRDNGGMTKIALLAFSSMLLAACSGGDTNEGGTSTDSDTAGSPDVELVYAHASAAASPLHRCGVEKLAELLNESESGMSLTTFADGQLYSDTAAQLDALASGELHLSHGPPNLVAAWAPAFSVLDAMYLFQDRDHAEAVLNGPLGEEISGALLEAANVRTLGWMYYGTRHVTSSSPVRGPDELDGVRLRTVDSQMSTYNGEVLGANPVPVAFPELFMALEQGIVDAQENPLPVIKSQSYEEVSDYLVLTGHSIQYFPMLVNESRWKELSPEQQEVVQEAVNETLASVDECTAVEEVELLEEWSMPDSPLEVIEDVDVEAFAERANEMYPGPFEEEWGTLYARIQDEAPGSGK